MGLALAGASGPLAHADTAGVAGLGATGTTTGTEAGAPLSGSGESGIRLFDASATDSVLAPASGFAAYNLAWSVPAS